MTDAATTLAEELRDWSENWPPTSHEDSLLKRAADVLLELARENSAMTAVESLCFPCAEKMRDALHAARNVRSPQ